ncbi:PREDICTED: amyloid beta A4 precursor protein-binding family B member 3 isoform X2 [Gavialis gangeticus]|uniref:amyloid beta A4 precursor protein-binding family B member 3 isoform X2 n=1 Tax=Gavialis gangeticus TaxID=94835 RepID=UPI00092E7A5F|nr:PREDICTED: amyloid beta A4 precursor protein-binding family B member 3 isoform X2 [Gavialis gangeticus]
MGEGVVPSVKSTGILVDESCSSSPGPHSLMLSVFLDNLWSDQNLETDPDLPPGWRKIRDSSGTYYWHVPTGTTQWQHPSCNSGLGGSLGPGGDATLQEMDLQAATVKHLSKEMPIPSPMASLPRRTSLAWHGEEFHRSGMEPGSKCFAVRSLGWVEIPEEDLAPGKSSIAVNNCIQQLSQSKCENLDPAGSWGEGQNMVMILKKDTMSLVDPLDHSLIHCQPIINIRVWGVGCNNGRDFAFVASDKDTCMLKCHVFHCNVPAKAIAKALHEMCSKLMAERAVTNNSLTRSVTLEPISPDNLPLQVDILDAVRQSIQKYDALYIGSLPVSKAMGMDVLNEAIENLTKSHGREQWTPSLISMSDSVMKVHQAEADEEDAHIWECQVRYVTFIGVGKDAHTFALIVDLGQQHFQCTAFWCEPDAGTISEAVQAACMVQYQKCLVASTSQMRPKGTSRSMLKMKRTASVDSPGCPFPATGHVLQKSGSSTSTRKRGVLSFLEVFRQKHSMLHTP